jgi:hypothetical protein
MPPPSRRDILTTATAGAGLVFATPTTHADSMNGGFVDCQTHLYFPEMLNLMEKRTTDPKLVRKGGDRLVVQGPWVRKVFPHHSDVKVKLEAMDAAGIELAALSINDPGPELFGNDGPALARDAHDWIAEICRTYPTRFFGLATLPLQDMTAAMSELQRCIGRLGFRGVLLYSNLDGRFPDEAMYRPLFEAAEAENVPVLLHPPLPCMANQVSGYELISGLGNMFDTTIALIRLIYTSVHYRAHRPSKSGAEAWPTVEAEAERVSESGVARCRVAVAGGVAVGVRSRWRRSLTLRQRSSVGGSVAHR